MKPSHLIRLRALPWRTNVYLDIVGVIIEAVVLVFLSQLDRKSVV